MTTPPFDPQPCGTGGAGGDAKDLENLILCDLDAQGNLLGTALAVYDYSGGSPTGAPTFVNPTTGLAYVPQGTLQVCPDAACLPPMQFCQTGTSTGPVEHPGRQYDITLPINPGFAVETMLVGATSSAAGITWDVSDPDGERFRVALTAFMESRLPAAAVVTITNPNVGLTICGTAAPMQVHIECLRLDQNPPDLIELVYNAGQDMVINPAYNETPPLNPPVAQGNYGYHLLGRQDNNVYPQNPPANRANCTNVANRGWETNDTGNTFEIWGQDVAVGVTPTPRGTPVQEIASDGPPAGQRSTIWQTFQAPVSGNFIIRIVHGARDAGENHRITLDNGDTGSAQNGTLINDVTTSVGVVTGGNNIPWTQFNQTIPLTSGQVYTLSISTNNPAGGARGGLFTDMRAYVDDPGQRATATNNDDTCIVTTQETTTTSTCAFWQPQCVGGTIAGWQKTDTGLTLTNAEFWAQTPTPKCCTTEAPASGGGSSATLSNMLTSDIVCVVVGGISNNAIRVIVTDPSGGVTQEQFLGPNGQPVQPTSWTAGPCASERFMGDWILCDFGNVDPVTGKPTEFHRLWVESVNSGGIGTVSSYRDYVLDSNTIYTFVGPVGDCASTTSVDREEACWTTTATGAVIHTGTIRHDDSLPAPGWLLFDQNQTLVPPTEPGLTFVPCSPDPFSTTGLCLADGTPIAVATRWNHLTGTYLDDGWVNLLTGAFSAGNPPLGTNSCSQSVSIQQSDVLCDITPADNIVHGLVLIQYHYNPDGTIGSTDVINATTGAAYTPVGQITVCPTDTGTPDNDMQVLCDRQADGSLVSFVRDYHRDAIGQINGFTNYTLAGAPYTVTGTVQSCIPRDSESIVLCDSAAVPVRFVRTYVYTSSGTVSGFTDTTLAGAAFTPTGAVSVCPAVVATDQQDVEQQILCDATPTRFLRTYKYDAETGAVLSVVNTTLDGTTAFTPVGAVGVCATTVATDFDFTEEVLCDANGTAFIRRFTFNSATGAVTATTNTTLAGVAFTPVGAVGRCTECCPIEIGRGCYTGGSGVYTAIRNADGTISLIDSVSGATVLAANIVACPSDDATVVLTAQHRLVGDADAAWTPGADVVGTLTSVTYTVLSGTATVVDQNGTSAAGLPAGLSTTWNAEDNNTLGGPTSIDAIGGSTYVTWTQR